MTEELLLPEPRWQWEKPDPDRSGSAGDLSKLFKNVDVKRPGVMEIDAPPDEATLLAREAIQNSWDAAIELQETWARGGTPPPFEIRFRYESASGSDKHRLVERLGLRELAERASSIDRKAVGLGRSDCLDCLADQSALPYLIIEESATTGMYGPWREAQSKLWLALVATNYTSKTSGEGGSYGFGKAGLIMGSAIRTVLAYTCFEERPTDPGITRRLMGMTYWGQHDLGDDSFTGFSRFGERRLGGTVRPFENEAADRVAESFGLEVRTPEQPELLGTTFLLVEPTVAEHDLVAAIERSWWPALEEDVFDAVVEGFDGRLHPRPRTDPVLRSFVQAYEWATIPQDNDARTARRYDLGPVSRRLGSLGLVADPEGWSYPEQTGSQTEERIDHRSLVALVRKPRMVVEYLPVPQQRRMGPPYVRGVFVADDGINDALCDTEPMGHDAWHTTTGDGAADGESAEIARVVIANINQCVANFRASLKPPARPPEDIRLDFFDSLMRRILSGAGSGRAGPPAEIRPVSIELPHNAEQVGADTLRVVGRATVSLSEHFEGDDALASVKIYYRLLDDETARDPVALRVEAPAGFTRVDGNDATFEGRLSHDAVSFEFASEPYSADWTGRLIAEVDLAEAREP